MCGKCCRTVTTNTPYDELLKLQAQGDEKASDFLRIFEPYPSIEAAKESDADIVNNIFSLLEHEGRSHDNMTFYRCKYLDKDNKCTIYETRPLLCKYFPSTPWAVVPPGCGFEGWLFLQREDRKQKVRKLKENLLEIENIILRSKSPEAIQKYTQVKEKIQATIDLFER